MLIGSGPITIGQACEFDYAGAQACKSLREDRFEIVLVNSNPATIMTDPDFADRTYIEPLTADILAEIAGRERPDAILPTLGGQTALNLAMELHEKGILDRFGMEMIGASADVILKAENRLLFKNAAARAGLKTPESGSARTIADARRIAGELASYPLIIRSGFTLGGAGSGIVWSPDEFEKAAADGLASSPISEILIEESVIGWKEFELEVMRDHQDNCVVVCSIENIDPMGVHTGDSITVAPAQTLTDREYQKMRDAAISVMREIGVDTGGANVQFAVNPKDGRMVVIEMNPRVSRSSALASKATGFPIAKIAAKLAVGYTLPELRNDITGTTSACFEPALDYVVTKVPRFAFEKFPSADDTLGPRMKSVGETMGIGRSFKESFQKALRSLETGRAGFGADERSARDIKPEREMEHSLARPSADRIFHIYDSFKLGWSVQRVHELTGIDSWFLRHMAELVGYEDEIRKAGSLSGLEKNKPLFAQAKELGYSDRQIGFLLNAAEDDVRKARESIGLTPAYNLVDTCAAEFKACTPYFYSSYGGCDETNPTGRRKIMIVGGGPNRIGQGIEFDYCCVHASFALRKAGFETIMVNSNPETVSTDYDTSDRLYFEPVTLEDVLNIYRMEQCWGAIIQLGGQTPLNLARDLQANGVNIIGTSPADIERAEDRQCFADMIMKLGIKQPEHGMAGSVEEAEAVSERIGYPVLIRPSFVLGGRAMVVVYDKASLRKYARDAVALSNRRPVLIDRYLEYAMEVDVDCVADGETCVIGAIMEHVELAGIHSGDSACIIPSRSLPEDIKNTIRDHTRSLARELNINGLMNVQYAVKNSEVYVIEANPRASRSVPFVSKAIGVPLAQAAALVMAGAKLKDIGYTDEIVPRHVSVKESVFPFSRFPGIDVVLSPEMKSTGEVMGIDTSFGMAFIKSQAAAGNTLPSAGAVFLSVRDEDKPAAVPLAKQLAELGFDIYATLGTSTVLRDNGIQSLACFKISSGRPNIMDLIAEQKVRWVVNVPDSATIPREDEVRMRAHSVMKNIPITTTLDGLRAAINGLKTLRKMKYMDVCSIQEYHRHAPRLKTSGLFLEGALNNG